MAKTEAATTSAPEAQAPVFSFGDFTFDISLDLPVSEDKAGQRTSEEPLPFANIFSTFMATAIEGKQPSFFVPVSFWQARTNEYFEKRGNLSQAKQLKINDVKDKMRDQFKKWAGDDATRKSLRLGFASRTGKEGIKGIDQPGVTVWLLKDGSK